MVKIYAAKRTAIDIIIASFFTITSGQMFGFITFIIVIMQLSSVCRLSLIQREKSICISINARVIDLAGFLYLFSETIH